MTTAIIKLMEIGCGKEIILSQIERGNIQATINNSKQDFKYQKYAFKTGLQGVEDTKAGIYKIILKLREIEPLISKYKQLYEEDFNNLRYNIEKYILSTIIVLKEI